MPMDAKQIGRGGAKPEFSNLQRLKAILISKLQQARGSTFARSTRRKSALGIGKDIDDVAIVSRRVEEIKMREDFTLQGNAQLTALGFQTFDLGRSKRIGRSQFMVDVGDGTILLKIEIVGVLQVIDGRDEVLVGIDEPIDDPTISYKIGYILIIMYACERRRSREGSFDKKNAQHLALTEENFPLRMMGNGRKHIIRNLPYSKLRMIVVWVVQDHYS